MARFSWSDSNQNNWPYSIQSLPWIFRWNERSDMSGKKVTNASLAVLSHDILPRIFDCLLRFWSEWLQINCNSSPASRFRWNHRIRTTTPFSPLENTPRFRPTWLLVNAGTTVTVPTQCICFETLHSWLQKICEKNHENRMSEQWVAWSWFLAITASRPGLVYGLLFPCLASDTVIPRRMHRIPSELRS